jgi:hypothetical protein
MSFVQSGGFSNISSYVGEMIGELLELLCSKDKSTHGAFLGRKFDMKKRISTFCCDRLGTPPRFKICDF